MAVLGEGVLCAPALAAANINPVTGLATDYLNHFNEVVMLMEMLPDMPDCAEDVLDWQPADYCTHFRQSTFKDKDLAILAYRAAPHEVRARLESLIQQTETAVLEAQERLRCRADAETCQAVADLAKQQIRPLITAASGTIHGREDGEADLQDEDAQADIDALFG